MPTRVMIAVRFVIPSMSFAARRCAACAVLSSALALMACRGRKTRPPSRHAVAADAARRPSLAARRAPLVPFEGPPGWPAQSLVRDGRPDFAPALPPHCTAAGPARHLRFPENAPAVFATATVDGRALFALAAGHDDDAGGATAVSDGATWVLERSDESPRWFRGPLEPGTTSTVAMGAAGSLRVAWARGGDEADPMGVVRIATFAAAPGDPEIDTLDVVADPVVTDLACSGARCVLAWGYREREDSETPERAVFSTLGESRPRRTGPPGAQPLNAIVPASDDLIGSVLRRDGRALVPEQPGVAAVPMHRSVLDVARIGDTLYAITASAPGMSLCQPGAWTVELARLDAGGVIRDPTPLATTDARPRGARLRAAGPAGDPMVTWLDAPQCAHGFFVIRAWRHGETTAVATASEYDVATDGPWLSLVWRERDRLRWVRARCDAASPGRDP